MVFDSRIPMLHTLDSNTAFFEDQPLLDEGLRFAVQMPILVDGGCVGTLNTDFKRYSNLSEAEMDLLCGIARQIATSVTASNKRPRTVKARETSATLRRGVAPRLKMAISLLFVPRCNHRWIAL